MNTETLSKKAQAEQKTQEAQKFLREVFATQERPTVWTSLKHVSSSGMSRDITLLTAYEGKILDITWYASHAMQTGTLKERNGSRVIRVSGAGMDMGFHLVYSLSYALYKTPDYGRAGYDLRHEWI
jgi:hypothetical protein